MAATQSGTVPLELYKHISLILNEYLGKECNHVKKTKTLDPNGGVISDTVVETTIYGAISPVSEDAVQESAGTFQYGDLVAYFLSEDGVLVGSQVEQDESRYDLIEYEGAMYSVSKKLKTAYDDGEAVVCKYVLRLVSDE